MLSTYMLAFFITDLYISDKTLEWRLYYIYIYHVYFNTFEFTKMYKHIYRSSFAYFH